MEFAVIGHCAGVVDLPVSLLMVCHARRLECVKSIDSTVSVHLCLRFSFSLQNRSFAAMPLSSLVCASVWEHRLSREHRLCVHHGGSSFWRRPAARVVGAVQVGGAGVWETSSCHVYLLREAYPVCFRKFHLLTSFPCCDILRRPDSGWWYCSSAQSRKCMAPLDHIRVLHMRVLVEAYSARKSPSAFELLYA